MNAAAPTIIVGHGPGVGDAAARAFALRGGPVALLARDRSRVDAAAAAIAADLGIKCIGLEADASDDRSLIGALDIATARLGTPGVVLYNAARWRAGPVLSIDAEAVIEDYRICVASAWSAARWAAPAMAVAGGGAILLTGGGLAMHPSVDAPTLSIGKAALRALALMLADELAPAGIRVGTVTIAGQVGTGALTPARIADAFLELAGGPPDRPTARARRSS